MSNERMVRWLGPLAIGTIVTFIIGIFILSMNEPNQNAPASQVVAFFRAHGTRETWSLYIVGIGLAMLAFCLSGLRTALRELNQSHSWLVTAGFAGGIIFLSGWALTGAQRLVLIDAARNNHVTLAGDLNFYTNVIPVVIFLGMAVMGLGFGAAVLTADALPNWVGVVGLVIGALSLAGGAGFIGVVAVPIWFAILGFVVAAKVAPHTQAEAQAERRSMSRLIPRHHH